MCVLCFIACKEQAYDLSPSQKTINHINTLSLELRTSSNGWQMIYYPKVDASLFTNYRQLWRPSLVSSDKYGLGGEIFLLKFLDNSKVNIKSLNKRGDINVETAEYSISLNSSLQLSFTTFSAIHKMINTDTEAVADFLFKYKDFNGDLIFATAKDSYNSYSVVVLKALQTEDDWNNALVRASENIRLFENMKNPQLVLKQGGRIFFQSDRLLTDERNRNERLKRHYHTFIYEQTEFKGVIIKGYNVMGSGYVASAEGLNFQPGFKIEKNFIVHDFQRQGDKFVAELVQVYDNQPLMRKFVNVSKHMYPNREHIILNYSAEIYDAPILNIN